MRRKVSSDWMPSYIKATYRFSRYSKWLVTFLRALIIQMAREEKIVHFFSWKLGISTRHETRKCHFKVCLYIFSWAQEVWAKKRVREGEVLIFYRNPQLLLSLMNEKWVWNNGGVKLTEETWSTRGETWQRWNLVTYLLSCLLNFLIYLTYLFTYLFTYLLITYLLHGGESFLSS
jgi:hypothetical protein